MNPAEINSLAIPIEELPEYVTKSTAAGNRIATAVFKPVEILHSGQINPLSFSSRYLLMRFTVRFCGFVSRL